MRSLPGLPDLPRLPDLPGLPLAPIRPRMPVLAGLSIILVAALVVPLAAGAPVADDGDQARIDARLASLFDRVGADTPVSTYVVHADGRTDAAMASLDALGASHVDLRRVGISYARLTLDQVRTLAGEPAVRSLYADHPVELYLEQSAPLVHAPQARERHGVDGTGVGIHMIDTGVDGTHPDLDDRVAVLAHTVDPATDDELPIGYVEGAPYTDWLGHGTHVAGIIAGTGDGLGTADPNHGYIVGMAPGAHLVSWSLTKPYAFTYDGLVDTRPLLDAVSGFEYALEKREEHAIRVSTNSWGFTGPADPDHPISVATQRVYEAGIAVVFASGNAGEPGAPNDVRTNMFSTLPWTVGVAASTKDGAIADFSSRGVPAADGGDPWDRPDIAAPGQAILSAKARASALTPLAPATEPNGPGTGNTAAVLTHYIYGSGTSMAAPHVAGVLALVFEANPELSPDQAYDILARTADPFAGELEDRGAGHMNASAAVAMARATPGELEAFLAGDRTYDGSDGLAHDALAASLDEGTPSGGAGQVLGAAADGGAGSDRAVPAAGWAMAVAALAGLASAVRSRPRKP